MSKRGSHNKCKYQLFKKQHPPKKTYNILQIGIGIQKKGDIRSSSWGGDQHLLCLLKSVTVYRGLTIWVGGYLFVTILRSNLTSSYFKKTICWLEVTRTLIRCHYGELENTFTLNVFTFPPFTQTQIFQHVNYDYV